jgi:hypothetical protein
MAKDFILNPVDLSQLRGGVGVSSGFSITGCEKNQGVCSGPNSGCGVGQGGCVGPNSGCGLSLGNCSVDPPSVPH